MRDILIKHKLTVDKKIKEVKKDLEKVFDKVIFTSEGYKLFRKDPEQFFKELQDKIAGNVLKREIPGLIKQSETFREAIKK